MYLSDIKFCKLEIFIPKNFLHELQDLLRKLDVGHIGNYDCCLSYSKVTSTWRPLENTNPFKGTQGEISQETELKVEVICKIENINEIVNAIKNFHPYEEPVINVIPVIKTGL